MPDSFKKIESSYVLSGIPVTYKDSHLYNFENKYDKKYAAFWNSLVQTATLMLAEPAKFPKFVFLCGTPGNGKTHYLIGLYRALVHQMGYSQGDGASFYTFASLAQEIIAGFAENIPIRTAMATYTQARYLFIDDFTASERILKANSLESTIFRDIVLDRYDKGYHLITSSNFNSIELMSELDKLFGDYVTSRLANSKVIQFPEKVDFRKVRP
jgi:DNA replication protein DnaC